MASVIEHVARGVDSVRRVNGRMLARAPRRSPASRAAIDRATAGDAVPRVRQRLLFHRLEVEILRQGVDEILRPTSTAALSNRRRVPSGSGTSSASSPRRSDRTMSQVAPGVISSASGSHFGDAIAARVDPSPVMRNFSRPRRTMLLAAVGVLLGEGDRARRSRSVHGGQPLVDWVPIQGAAAPCR